MREEGEAERPLGLVLVTSGEVFRFGEFTFPVVVPTGLPNARVTVSFSLGGVRGVDETDGRDVTDTERTLVLLESGAEVAAI